MHELRIYEPRRGGREPKFGQATRCFGGGVMVSRAISSARTGETLPHLLSVGIMGRQAEARREQQVWPWMAAQLCTSPAACPGSGQ